jgi:hypothetical protein
LIITQPSELVLSTSGSQTKLGAEINCQTSLFSELYLSGTIKINFEKRECHAFSHFTSTGI